MRVTLDDATLKTIETFRANKIPSSYLLFKLNQGTVYVAEDGKD